MKKYLYAIAFGILLSACAGIKTFNDSDVSIYMGRFNDLSCYFYLDKGGRFYMLDRGGSCEIGQCRISQDTLYCHPSMNKMRKETTFLVDSASLFYVDSPTLQPVYEEKYLLKDNRLYFFSELDPNSQIHTTIMFLSEDAFFEKIDIKDDPKYRKKVLPPM